MLRRNKPLIESLPSVTEARHRLGDALREVELLRVLLRLSERAEQYRAIDRHTGGRNKESAHGHS